MYTPKDFSQLLGLEGVSDAIQLRKLEKSSLGASDIL